MVAGIQKFDLLVALLLQGTCQCTALIVVGRHSAEYGALVVEGGDFRRGAGRRDHGDTSRNGDGTGSSQNRARAMRTDDADDTFDVHGLGCISEADAYCFEKAKSISDCNYAIEGFYVRPTTNWLDVLEAFAQNDTNMS